MSDYIEERKKRMYSESMVGIRIIKPVVHGGPGSGNFGHEGRPGLRGGSAPGSTGAWVEQYVKRFFEHGEIGIWHFNESQDILRQREKDIQANDWATLKDKDHDAYNSLTAWSMRAYGDINRTMWGTEDEPYTHYHIDNINRAIDESPPIKEGTLIFRGVDPKSTAQLLDAEPGTTFEDKGFQSFSIQAEIAKGFSYDHSEPIPGSDRYIQHQTVLAYEADGKTRGIYIGSEGEEEVLLKPSKWEVVRRVDIEGPKFGTLQRFPMSENDPSMGKPIKVLHVVVVKPYE
jgi:hypothetical protein